MSERDKATSESRLSADEMCWTDSGWLYQAQEKMHDCYLQAQSRDPEAQPHN